MTMKNYVFMTDDGKYVKQTGRGFSVPEGAIEVDAVNNVEDYFSLMWVDGGWLQRPVVDEPPPYFDGTALLIRDFRNAVNNRRSRLIEAGVVIDVTGYGPVALQGRPEDQTSLQGLAFGAQLRLGMGDSTTLTNFLDRNNVQHQLLPMQILEIWQKGAAFVSAIYARSWAIKAMDPTSTNIDDPALWSVEA